MEVVQEMHDTNGTNDFVYANKEIHITAKGFGDTCFGYKVRVNLISGNTMVSDNMCDILTGDVEGYIWNNEQHMQISINGLSSKIRGAEEFRLLFQLSNGIEVLSFYCTPFYVIFPMEVWNMQFQIQELYRNQLILQELLRQGKGTTFTKKS